MSSVTLRCVDRVKCMGALLTYEQEMLTEWKGTEMYFNAMQREELKQTGWYEKADGSWEIDVDGHVYYLYREDDGLFVIVTELSSSMHPMI